MAHPQRHRGLKGLHLQLYKQHRKWILSRGYFFFQSINIMQTQQIQKIALCSLRNVSTIRFPDKGSAVRLMPQDR